MAIMDYSDAMQAIVLTAFKLSTSVKNCHPANNVSGPEKHLSNNCMLFLMSMIDVQYQIYCLSAYLNLLHFVSFMHAC